MDNQGIFKTSAIGGFNKQSVLTYVDDLIARGQEREEELRGEAAQLSEERDRLAGERDQLTEERGQLLSRNEQLQAECEQLTAQRDQMKAERAQMLAEWEKLQAQNAQLGARAAELERRAAQEEPLRAELERQNARTAALEAQLRQAREQAAALEMQLREQQEHTAALEAEREEALERGRRYDGVATQVGAVMVEAQKQADSIISRARQQAEQIERESMDHIYEMNRRMDLVKDDVARLREAAVKTLEQVDQRMAELETSIQETEGHLYISAGLSGAEDPEERDPPWPREHVSAAPEGETGGAYSTFEEPFFTSPRQG